MTMSSDCTLVSGYFARLIQIFLGIIAVSSLYLKRQIEVPRRPFQVWVLDASKQTVAAGCAHVFNMTFAILFSHYLPSTSRQHNECTFYFINGFVDTTIGVSFIYLSLQCLITLAHHCHWPTLQSPGKYGQPLAIDYYVWWMQFWTWILLVVVAKCMMAVVIYVFETPLLLLANVILAPVQSRPQLELVVVMLIFPGLYNVAQFWVRLCLIVVYIVAHQRGRFWITLLNIEERTTDMVAIPLIIIRSIPPTSPSQPVSSCPTQVRPKPR